MKFLNQRQKKTFPLAMPLKKVHQQWNPLRRLSREEGRLFKNKFRSFSMEYGRSLPKRLLWQIAVTKPGIRTQPIPMEVSFFRGLSTRNFLQEQKKSDLWPFVAPFQQNWAVFRSVFFGKMWILNHPSLVPGLVWPIKSQKSYLMKLRAWKALSQLTGPSSLRFLKPNLQKLWNLPSHLTPSLWSLAAGLDSLPMNVVLKSGFIEHLSLARHLVSRGHYRLNDHRSPKCMSFNYPGDIIRPSLIPLDSGPEKSPRPWKTTQNLLWKPAHLFPSPESKPAWIFSPLWTLGSAHFFKKNMSAHTVLPFLWTSFFYHRGPILNTWGQKSTQKDRSYKKRTLPRYT